MADNIPDFRTQTRSIDPMAIANILQRKGQIEQEQRNFEQQRRDKMMEGIAPAVEAGQKIASNMMDLAAKRNQAKGLSDLTSLLSQPDSATPSPDRQGQLVQAFARANPEKFTAAASKAIFKEPNEVSLEQKEILHNGVPTVAGYNPKTNSYYAAGTNAKLDGEIKPYNQNADTTITDQDRKELTPLAKAVIEGRALPSALLNARGERKEKLTRIAAELDPTFDLSLAPQRIKMRQDFASSGKTGQTLTSLNTVIGHLDTLNTKADKLDSKQVTKYNTISNYVQNNIGKPEVKEFNAAKQLVISELGKVAQGSGVVTNEERKQFADEISAASSPSQVKGVTATWIDLMKSRTDSIKANWDTAMPGMAPPIPIINNKAKKILVKNGYNPDTMEKTGDGQSNGKVDAFFASLLGKQ